MSLMRFVERRLPRIEGVDATAANAYRFHVDIYIGRPFRGHITLTCSGPMKGASPTIFSSMSTWKGHEATFHFDTTKDTDHDKPITISVLAETQIHVVEVRLVSGE